jgi:hypothetical protein
MSVFLSPNLPANVVEIGNEISQAKINEINAGTLATQTWVTTGFAPKASPTFTGTVTIPAGASISGYLTTSSASSTYQTIAGMSSYQTIAGMGAYATYSYLTSNGYLTDAPADGSEYVRKNATWAVATGGGGGGISDAPSDGNLYARQNAAWASFTIPTLSVTNIDLTGNFNGYNVGTGPAVYSFRYDSTANTLRIQDSSSSGITVSATAITFPDSTTLSSSAKSVNTVTSTYTAQLSDANNIVFLNGGGTSISLLVPDDYTVNFPIGTIIIVLSDDTSNAVGQGTSGAPSLNGGSGSALPNRVTHLVKKGANSWYYT